MTLMTDTLKLVARDNDTMGSLGCMESTGSGFSSAHSAWAARHSAWLDQPRAHGSVRWNRSVRWNATLKKACLLL